MAPKRSSDDSVDKASDKDKRQHATLSPVGEVSEEHEKKKKKKSSSSNKPKEKPKPNPDLHNSGASSPPSTEGKGRNQKQPAVRLPLEEQSPGESEIYDLLQAAVAEVGVKLPIPEIVAIGGRSHGKSSLLEALFFGFRFNAGDDEMGTRRPLFLQMRHDSTAVEPKFRFQEENSEKYEAVAASDIAGSIKRRTESHLQEINAAVSAKPIVISAEFADCLDFTIIDTPDLANSGGDEDTSDKILEIVKSLATPHNRLVLFCQHIRQPICPNMLEMLKMFVPTSRRAVIVLFMFDDELQSSKEEVCNLFRTTSKKLETSIHPFFVAIPKHHRPKGGGMLCSDDFLKQIYKLDIGAFNEDRSRIGLSCLKYHLKSEIDNTYMKIVAPATLALLQERFTEASEKLARLNTKEKAISDISQLRASAMRYAHSFCTHLHALLDGAEGPAPEYRGKTTSNDLSAIERVMNEFSLDTKSMSSPHLAINQVGNRVLSLTCASAGSIELDKAGAEVACTRAQLELAPLIHNACDRLNDVLKELFDLTRERMHKKDSQYQTIEHIDVCAGFLLALRCSYDNFIEKLSKKCKMTVQHRLDSAISTYSYIFNENEASKDMSSIYENEASKDMSSILDNENEASKDMSSTLDNEDQEVTDVVCQQDNAITKIKPNADIEEMYPHIWAASDKYFVQIQDLIKKDAPTELRSGFLNPCRDELLPALFREHFVKDDGAFKGMFDTLTALNTIDKERESLLKRQQLLTSCQKHIRNICESRWLNLRTS